ncbi:MAG TPA: hypothetical protein VMK65_07770 [Longimicrobiales bacterium]|nr:hypothetical protein [Longimicrobiales bacterium]
MGTRPYPTLATAVVALALAAPQAHAQARATLQWIYPVETIYVSDFTPYTVGHHPDLLAITLMNGAAGSQTVVLELTATMERPRSLLVFTGTTDPFVLSGTSRRLTNRDLASNDRDVSFAHFDVGDETEDVIERMGYTGRLPSGTYRFAAVLRTPEGVELDRSEVLVELANPSRVELVSPGRPFGEPPPVVVTPSPRFIWSVDAGAGMTGSYELRVARADGAGSAEEAMEGFAVWEHRTGGTTAQYPGSVEAIRLEAGATYVWQVVREVRTSGGTERVESPIYTFRLASTAAGTDRSGGEEVADRLMQELIRTLGLGSELAGFRPSGPLLIDGRTVSQDALQELLRAIAAGEIALRSITVR